jgi:hypothetical protein
MNNDSNVPEGKDPQLWEIAKKRAGFKSHLYSYLIINVFLWVLWYVRNGNTYQWNTIPWPLWVTLGWGIGLAFNYVDAYIYPKVNSVEKEYDKLKNQNK